MERADGIEAELAAPSLVSALATIVVAVAALLLAGLPAAIALHVLALPVGLYEAALGCFGAAVGGVKLIAMAWAAGGRLSAAHPAGRAVAPTLD